MDFAESRGVEYFMRDYTWNNINKNLLLIFFYK